jgi:hypothetical protein
MASDYVPRSTVVYVTERVDNGKGCSTTHWQYDTNKNTHFGGKLGRRVGKHGPQRKAHCTESEVIRTIYHEKEVANGFAQYRVNLARQRQYRDIPTLSTAQREALLLKAQRSREMSIIILQGLIASLAQ